ncbi:competence protein [Renibacterium salmoninarum ATCC 33209]|uniref:Competence protein n=2 Tax=Renibacterium salmoninarum TaxID=1646 RepID=A9WS83_RENSM|nr:competence protein [Renibacterium salmoninarum ATCC 33209]
MARRSKQLAMAERIAQLFPTEQLVADSEQECPAVEPSGGRSEDVPTPRTKRRWPRNIGTMAVVVSIVLAVLIGGTVWWLTAIRTSSDAPSALQTIASSRISVPAPGQSGTAASTTDSALVVHVIGAVARPGVIRLASGSRLFQAIDAAGGATDLAVLSAVNLAAQLADGEQIFLPTQAQIEAGQVPATTTGAASPNASNSSKFPAAKVNINAASVDQLAELPKVGPKMAQKIVQWRAQHGKFSAIDDLDAIDGIGPKLLDSLRALVTI